MKIDDFRKLLDKKKCDFAVFYNSDSAGHDANMLYFSGYSGMGALIVPKNKPAFLIVPEMEFHRAKKSMVKRVYSMEKKKFFESIYRVIKRNKLKAKSIAVDKNKFTLNSYRYFRKQFGHIKAKDIAIDCMNLRQTKTEKEIKFIKKSCSFADRILQRAIKNFKDFRTESQAAAFLEYEAKKNGLELSFNPIVASGSNGSMPHHIPSNAKLKKGFCVIDFGVKYRGYCSDITRTIYLGKPDQKEKDIYHLLLKIQKGAVNLIEINKKCSELYDFVVKNLGKYKKYFTHGLGHGVGVEIHEMPNLTLNSKDRIRNGMVFTIEPGIYFPGKYGIRIEDTLLFKNKPILLTKTSKDLITLD